MPARKRTKPAVKRSQCKPRRRPSTTLPMQLGENVNRVCRVLDVMRMAAEAIQLEILAKITPGEVATRLEIVLHLLRPIIAIEECRKELLSLANRIDSINTVFNGD